MKLVVVESPSKAKTIKKYLGNGYEVIASKGHIVDLPKSGISIDVNNNYTPTYQVTNPKVLSEIKKLYKGSDKLILAVDLDREGEAIAWHLAQKLGAVDIKGKAKKGHLVERIVFSEITKDAIQHAINNPRDIDMDMVNAQQARRFLDRLVGYKLSPLLWKKIMFGLSAGRVQSVALKLVVEKEKERRSFIKQEYWSVNLGAQTSKINVQDIKFNKIDNSNEEKNLGSNGIDQSLLNFEIYKKDGKDVVIQSYEYARDLVDSIKDKELIISDLNSRIIKRSPKPPFITSTLQQSAINKLSFSAKKVMMVAQKLYEKGFITYMRTDSLNLSKQSLESIRKYILKNLGDKYLTKSEVVYSSKSKNAQEAHEAIRPVDVNVVSDKDMDSDMQRLYDLIRNRTIATQMVNAEIEQNNIISKIDNVDFKITGSRILFDGYLKVTKDRVSENMLPSVKVGDVFFVKEIVADQHYTQPVARYSEASLVKKLEELGIGRPSTYASIISTIVNRTYVDKDGKYLVPTTKGEVVSDLLEKYFSNIVDYNFTASLEDKLDEISNGKEDWIKMLDNFYVPFEEQVNKNDKDIPRGEFTVLGDAPDEIRCPECSNAMQKKLGRYGEFYSCSNWPDCKGMRGVDGKSESENINESKTDEFKYNYENPPKTEKGEEYVYKKGRYGGFWAHPEYPKVKDAKPLVYRREKLIELFGEIPATSDGRDFVLRSGKYGQFWAHPEYPKVKEIKKIPKYKKDS